MSSRAASVQTPPAPHPIFSVILLFIDLISWAQFSTPKNITTIIQCERPDKCSCPKDPITERYSDPVEKSCDRYYLCHMGNAFLKQCDVRHAFHPEKKECLPRNSVPLDLCPIPVNCDKNGFREDPKDCTMYYMCFYRQAYHYGCKVDHFYDKDKEECALDKVKATSCNKARSEVYPKTSVPKASKHHKRMLTEFIDHLPSENTSNEEIDRGLQNIGTQINVNITFPES